jgi:hypothetical protein
MKLCAGDPSESINYAHMCDSAICRYAESAVNANLLVMLILIQEANYS